MRSKIITVIALSFCFSISQAQSKKQISQMEDLCKTWGNLKYFHPEIAIGKYNWDSILVVSANQILNSGNKNVFQSTIDKMLQIAGDNYAPEFKIDKSAHQYTYRNINHSWIDKSKNLTGSQKEKFKYNYSHPFQGVNYYAQPNKDNEGTVLTSNENPYKDMNYPNPNYRLLGLFRYWNVINYFYPYKYAIGKSWDDVLSELIPQFMNATNVTEYQKTVAKLAASINDSHGMVQPSPFLVIAGKYRPPFIYKIVENKAVITKISDSIILGDADIQIGSVIETINNTPLSQKIKEYWDYVSASNATGKTLLMQTILLRSNDSNVSLTGYKADGTRFSTIVELTDKKYSMQDYADINDMTSPIISKMITDKIGYIFASNISKENIDSVMTSMIKTTAIIIDLRNYPPTGTVAFKLPEYLLTKPMIYSRLTRPDFRMPGLLIYDIANAGKPVEKVGRDNPNPYQGKIILLVDSRTMSGAEFTCMALQAYKNVAVIGNQTAGADGNVTGVSIPGGFMLYFSGFGIYYPDNKETQRVGIPIDIPVEYTVQDFIDKKDPILEKAIDYAKEKK